MFDDPQWRQISPRLYYGEIYGTKRATWNPRFDNFALNEMLRVIAGKLEGKLDIVSVSAVKRNDTGRLVGHEVDAE